MDGPLSAAGNCLACGKGPRSFSRRSRPFSPGQPGALAASGRAALAKAGPFAYKTFRHGAWRSMVAHLLWEQGVAGSNPVAPTIKNHEVIPQDVVWPLFLPMGSGPRAVRGRWAPPHAFPASVRVPFPAGGPGDRCGRPFRRGERGMRQGRPPCLRQGFPAGAAATAAGGPCRARGRPASCARR